MPWIVLVVAVFLVDLAGCGGGSRETPVYPEDQFAIPQSVVVPDPRTPKIAEE